MAWISLIIAGFCEVAGVMAINKINRDGKFTSYLLLAITFACSFGFLSYSMRSISMGTAYAVWTGIGTAGGALLGMFFYGESKEWRRILFISMVLCSAVGLKLLT
ncbi:multidrug efflux SMR transporter [Paenibacillus terrigena]|uniref:DMT family transporter n=1 Tax=Paenibacillus terrigena TaxID=369333 RepID=UPI0028D4D646|nr:multidrug efflux SMR transporter [Paenibacillus terrigena]